MNVLIRAAALAAAYLVSSLAIAGAAVPMNASFGIQWTPVDWSNPADRITETLGAAAMPNANKLGIATRDHLGAIS